MDYFTAIERIYDHLENDHVDKAVMICLRMARNRQDFLYAAVFLREMNPSKDECMRIVYNTTSHLTQDAQKFFWEHSLIYWLDTHTLNFSLGENPNGEKKKDVLTIGISEIESELELWDRTITDMQVPTGMGVYDTAAFADEYSNQKTTIRLRVKALQTVKQQIKTRCLDYAIRIECELKAKNKSQSFLAQIHTDVNNYLKSHSEDVYTKLNKAAELVDSNDLEDCSLLLTQVRRAIKASADFLYPPKKEMVKCKDGIKRDLGNDQYLNRLQEYIAITFDNSSSRDLLRSELEYLANFARRLNDVASKGVHADVNPVEAKQGLLGLYMFLYNVTSRLQCHSSQSKAAVTQSG